ncbi:deoxyguanosinetriphosphate triphosphohydrolase [Oceanobacter mangrovi]|uniref:deoxyguanosinetriphosphate triphosphohydrolase n=1 Tax=Oceanobacter mangrovi TaxID=2862510 RepID=UPI001C8E428B|nr:deoxyguanosinetriphosphate triphosphohydrolase [Oceanobacter mangrovi]
MNWQRLLSPLRYGETQARLALDLGRTPFHKDYDRIIFSSAFRRLNRKTQVHPLTENDHLHSRLTHSLEVGCVGRSLGSMVGEAMGKRLPQPLQPSDLGALLQAACLAHDIGNPPYGHCGEDAIRHWFREPSHQHLLEGLSDAEKLDLMTFEGNAQGLRLVTQVEYNRFKGGMRLTCATLGTFLKYPWTANEVAAGRASKFGCYQSELPILQEIATTLGLLQTAENRWCRHPLVYLVEAADDICYGLIDLEDGVEVGLLRYQEVEDLLSPLLQEQWEQVKEDIANEDGDRRKLQVLRGYAMEVMVQAVSANFLRHEDALLEGRLQGCIIDYCPAPVRNAIGNAKQLARERIFRDGRKLTIEIGAYSTLGTLLEAFLTAARECTLENQSTFRNSRLLELMGGSAPQPGWTLYQSYMRTLDYISGMTDTYAASLAKQFAGYRPPSGL